MVRAHSSLLEADPPQERLTTAQLHSGKPVLLRGRVPASPGGVPTGRTLTARLPSPGPGARDAHPWLAAGARERERARMSTHGPSGGRGKQETLPTLRGEGLRPSDESIRQAAEASAQSAATET